MKKLIYVVMMLITISANYELYAASNSAQVTSESQFQNYISANPAVFLVVTAKWCPHCRVIKPLIEQLTQEMRNVMFVHIDADNASLADKYAPDGFPSFKIYKNGNLKGSLLGEQSKATLENMIKSNL